MKSGTETKAKFKLLQRKLRLPLWQARGLLDTFWAFVAHNCPQGDVGRFSDDEIAVAIEWQDDAAVLIAALVETRWLDRNEQYRLIAHDWPEHCEDSVHRHLARKQLYFADGSAPKLTRLTADEKRDAVKFYCATTSDIPTVQAAHPPACNDVHGTPKDVPSTHTGDTGRTKCTPAITITKAITDTVTSTKKTISKIKLDNSRIGEQERIFFDLIRHLGFPDGNVAIVDQVACLVAHGHISESHAIDAARGPREVGGVVKRLGYFRTSLENSCCVNDKLAALPKQNWRTRSPPSEATGRLRELSTQIAGSKLLTE